MSYILNALRKSERERSEKAAETLQNRILKTQPIPPRRFSWLSAFLVMVNLGLLSYFVWSQIQRQPSVLITDKAPEPEKNQQAVPAPPESRPEKEVQVQPDPKPSLSFAEQMQIEAKPRSAPIIHAKPAAAVKKQVVAPSLKPRQMVKQKLNADIALKARNETVTQPVQELPEDRLPYLEELPFAFRSKVPQLNINVFVYGQNPADSFVMIDMKKYAAGQFVQDKLKLLAIKANSLVMSYQGKTFQIKRP